MCYNVYTKCIVYILCQAREPASSRSEPPQRARQTTEPSQAHAPSLAEPGLARLVSSPSLDPPLQRMAEPITCLRANRPTLLFTVHQASNAKQGEKKKKRGPDVRTHVYVYVICMSGGSRSPRSHLYTARRICSSPAGATVPASTI